MATPNGGTPDGMDSSPSVSGTTPTISTVGGAGREGKKRRGGSKVSNQEEQSDVPKDRHEPRGRKPNDGLPPSRAREVQRAFRLRRAEHLAALEERINLLEAENSQLRALLSLPEAERERIGSGPTGRGKSLQEGGVPMSERVRARKEARARERRLRGLPEPDEDSHDDEAEIRAGDAKRAKGEGTASPRASSVGLGGLGLPGFGPGQDGSGSGNGHGNGQGTNGGIPMFGNPHGDGGFNMPFPNLGFNLPMTPENPFDFESAIFKPPQPPGQAQGAGQGQGQGQGQGTGPDQSPGYAAMLAMFEQSAEAHNQQGYGHGHQVPLAQPHPQHLNAHTLASSSSAPGSSSGGLGLGLGGGSNAIGGPGPNTTLSRQSPISPPISNPPSTPAQPDLLTRLRQCCHLSDSHVVNDPGLLIFATRLCQSFPCSFGGAHADASSAVSDSDHLLLDDSWRLLRNQLDPGTEIDGEHRINTGRMAAELVIRAAHSRGPGGWIVCRYSQGMSVKRQLVAGLIQGLGGSFE